MIERSAFHSLSYGMFVVAAKAQEAYAGCVINTFAQLTSTPLQASIALNKENATTAHIRESARFSISVLTESCPMETIGLFGFKSGRDLDKFSQCNYELDSFDFPYLTDHCCAHFNVRVTHEVDLGTHILFIGEVQLAETLSQETPLTYTYYQQVKGGKTPKLASSYLPKELSELTDEIAASGVEDTSNSTDEKGMDAMENQESQVRIGWRCTICGHIEWVDELPEDFECPICGVGKSMFERIEEAAE